MGHTARPVLRRTCMAVGCELGIPPKRVFCPDHWFAVPAALRVRVLNELDAWLASRSDPSPDWRKACAAAVVAIAEREGRAVPDFFRQMAETGLAVVA
jgi:hypothetical protein